jgi:hypothetical protein
VEHHFLPDAESWRHSGGGSMSNKNALNGSARGQNWRPAIDHNRPTTFDDVVQENLASGLHLAQRDILVRAIHDRRLQHRHRIVLAALIQAANDGTGMAYPGYARLAKNTGYTPVGVSKTVSELVELGYLLRIKRSAYPGSRALMHYCVTRPTREELEDIITAHMQVRRDASGEQLRHSGWRPDWADSTPAGKVSHPDLTLPLGVKSGPDSTPVGRVGGADSTPVVPTGKKERKERNEADHDGQHQGKGSVAGATKLGNKLASDWALPDDWRQWSKGKFQFSDADVDKLKQDFTDYWTSSGRSQPPKREWFHIWQEWTFFEAFWKAFPPGRKQGKPKARETFLSIINGAHKTQGRATPERLVEAAKGYAAKNPDPKYTPMPAKWLNEGRWEDEGNQPQDTASQAGIDPDDPRFDMPQYDPQWDAPSEDLSS